MSAWGASESGFHIKNRSWLVDSYHFCFIIFEFIRGTNPLFHHLSLDPSETFYALWAGDGANDLHMATHKVARKTTGLKTGSSDIQKRQLARDRTRRKICLTQMLIAQSKAENSGFPMSHQW